MNTKLTNKTQNFVALCMLSIAIAVVYVGTPLVFKSLNAEASSLHNVTGWAWSENIGWVSANCTTDGTCSGTQDYGVNINPATGDFSGTAWSENVGWISFDRSKTNNPPSAPYNSGLGAIAHYASSTGTVTGWARALSGCQDNAATSATSCSSTSAGTVSTGWDGWIQLNNVTINGGTGDFSGFGWGDSVIGWLQFSMINSIPSTGWKLTTLATPAATLNFTSPASVVTGGTGTASWTTTDATSIDIACDSGPVNAQTAWTAYGLPANSNKSVISTATMVGATHCTATAIGPGGNSAPKSFIWNVSPVISCGDNICTSPIETKFTCPIDCKSTFKIF